MSSFTEEEAKTKWCPFARTTERFTDGVTYPRNRVVVIKASGNDEGASHSGEPINDLVGTKCLGSACMAWRADGHTEEVLENTISMVPGKSAPRVVKTPSLPLGYCGLAGKP